MSGFLGTVGRAEGLVSGVATSGRNLANLVSGARAGSATPRPGTVSLGTVTLSSHEAPDSLPWGTTMGLVEHEFPGGEKFFTLTGPQRKDISWSGKMIGADAVARAKVLDKLCSAGKVVPLRWGTMSFTVILSSFEAEYKRENWIGSYKVTCKVYWDYAAIAKKVDPAQAVKGGLTGALNSVASGLGAVVGAASSVVATAQGIVSGVSSVITPITSALGIHLPILTTLTRGLISAQGAVGGLGGLSAGTASLGNVGDLLGSAQVALSAGISSTGSALTALGGTLDLTATTAMAGAQATMAQAATSVLGGQAALAGAGLIPVTATTLAAPPTAADSVAATFTAGTPAFASGQQAAATGTVSAAALTTNPATFNDASAQLATAINGYRAANAIAAADAVFDAANGLPSVASPQELFKQIRSTLPPGTADGTGFQISTNGMTYTFNNGLLVNSTPGTLPTPAN